MVKFFLVSTTVFHFRSSSMKVTVTCYSPTNFGIFVNDIFQTNYTDISGDFKPEAYSIVVPKTNSPAMSSVNAPLIVSQRSIEFLNIDYR